MAQVLKVESEGKPFSSMRVIVCKTDEEAEEIFHTKGEGLLDPRPMSDHAVWGNRAGLIDAFAHTFIGRKGNLVFEIVLYEGAGMASKEELARMHQQYLSERRELDTLIERIMR